MREDIVASKENGEVTIDLSKAIGRGYGNFWFTNNHCRYRFLKGSRNSKKSVTVSYEIVMKIVSDERRNILVCRQNYVDIRNSIYESITRAIYDLGFEKYFKFTTQPLEITYIPTGQKILFRGLNNTTSLTSLSVAKGYLTDCIIEEFYEVDNPEDFRKVDGCFRGRLPEGLCFQITCMFNAWSAGHWSYNEFFKNNLEDDQEYLETHNFMDWKDENYVYGYGKGLYLHISTYKINEFRDTEDYDLAMKEMKIKDPDRYATEALGCWGVGSAICYPAFNETCIRPVQDLLSKQYIAYAIGVDTGLSTAEGKKHTVGKGEDASIKIRSATTMCLMGITAGYREIVILDEYYHSNDKNYFYLNTDKDVHPGAMTQPELASELASTIRRWRQKYENYTGKPRGSSLFNGIVDIYVDAADVGFRQTLELECRKQEIYMCRFMTGGKKLSIRSRVDFENALQHYGCFLVCKEQCPDTILEFKNARVGEKGEARQDHSDHILTAIEYAYTPYWLELIQQHNFKEHN